MKKIVCEMCCSNDVIKDGEFYVCQACGTKYTVESARSLLKDIGTLDIKGKVEIDSSNQVESLTAMANNALSLNNYKDALNYIEKILAIDPQNYNALFLKGKAINGIYTLKDKYNAFSYALQCVPSEKESALIEDITSHLVAFYSSLLDECAKEYNTDVIVDRQRVEYERAVENISNPFNTDILKEKIKLDKGEVLNPFFKKTLDFAKKEGERSIQTIKKVIKKNESLWCNPCAIESKNIEIIFAFLDGIIKYTTDLAIKVDAIELYVDFSKDACKLKYYRGANIYTSFLDDRIIENIEKNATLYKNQITSLKKELDNKRKESTKKYWKEHSEEKKALEEKLVSLEEELNNIKPSIQKSINEIKNVANGEMKTAAQLFIDESMEKIKNLSLEKSKLGIFKGKRKAEIDKEIEALRREIEKTRPNITKQKVELQNEIRSSNPDFIKFDKLNEEIKNINEELTKDR